LPSSPSITDDEIRRVAACIRTWAVSRSAA
jgi:hypothetical protein